MNEFVDYFNNLDNVGVIIFYSVCAMILSASILLIIILIKQKHYNKNTAIVAVNNLPAKVEPVINNPIPSNNNQYNDLTDELINRNLSSTTKIDINNIAKQIATDLEEKTVNYTDFEKDQEEKSIISYEELRKAAQKDELPNVINYKIETTEDKKNITNEQKRFIQSPLISPVFGISGTKETFRTPQEITTKEVLIPSGVNTTKDLEATLNIEPLNIEIKKNDEFLKALKDFRNNL